jgi:hypothetical protein
VKNYGWITVAMAAALTACSGGGSASGVPPRPNGSATGTDNALRAVRSQLPPATGVWGQVVHALPNNFTLNVCRHETGTFDALENFEGDVTAAADDPKIVSVSPDDQRNQVYPTEGGLKNAWFTITPLAAGSTTVTVRDKKNNADRVTVTVIGCPTPAPTGTPFPGWPTNLPPGGIH